MDAPRLDEMHTTMSSIPLGSTGPDNSEPIEWAKKRRIEPIKSSCRWQLGCPRLDGGITIMSSNPLGSTAPDNSGPIGWSQENL